MSIRDARRLSAANINADVAIVGAGAAGIALAREFANQSIRVAVIESGDFKHRHRTQFLYRGENIGRTNISTSFSRLRRFGGSTTRWGGQCRPLDPIDFETRPDVPLSGWPIDYANLPYWDLCAALHLFRHAADWEAWAASLAQRENTASSIRRDLNDFVKQALAKIAEG